MNTDLKEQLLQIAKDKAPKDDPSHDIMHVRRVLFLAEQIAKTENADLDVIVPAALFHDIVNYPKNDPRSAYAAEESAQQTAAILATLAQYPQEKIRLVTDAINTCSFNKGAMPATLEGKVLQDADMLEATGAISIMRTFCSAGTMRKEFYNAADPFCESREPDATTFALDLFWVRLLKVQQRMHTAAARAIAKRRTEFLEAFLAELRKELEESTSPQA